MKNTATILMDEYLELLNFKKSVMETELIVEYVKEESTWRRRNLSGKSRT